MKFSFVIPAYNNYKLLHQLLWDIYKNCSPCYEIIVTDNGDDQETVDGLNWWAGLLPVRHIRNKKNMGFLKNSNNGLKLATGDALCLISTDVRIHQDIVKYTLDDSYLQTVWGGRYLDFDTGWNSFNGEVFPYLEGWLLCASREDWKELDYFDEQFAPHDMEDVDFSTKVRKSKLPIKLGTYPEGYVSHIGAQTIGYNPEREKLTLENKKKFYEKWVA